MDFRVHRTSSHEADKEENEKPCEEAFTRKSAYVDWRNIRTLAEAPLLIGNDFLTSGTNHREEGGRIARDLDPNVIWVVKLDSLEELLQFIDKHKEEVVISREENYKGVEYTIEIYDDYRE